MNLPDMVWMEIDVRHNELPLRIADSAAELARMCGVKEVTVKTQASHVKHGRPGRYCRVWIGGV